MAYNFDEPINRQNTNCLKWDARKTYFGSEDVLPMWVADMDFKTPDFIKQAIIEHAQQDILGYSLKPDSFYDSIINWQKRRHGWDIKKEWIATSPGVVAAVSLSVLCMTAPNDKIIIQPPVYHPFYFVVRDNGRQLLTNALQSNGTRFFIDFEDLEGKAKDGAKMLILSNPHNPGGMVWTKDELNKLADICEKHDMLILSDEIHCDLVFKKFKHTPLASLNERIAARTITAIAPSKTFNIAGMSTSVVIIPNQELMAKYKKILETIHVSPHNILGITALEAAFTHGDQWVEELMDYLQTNVWYVKAFLERYIPEIKLMEPEATYLLWMNCEGLGLDDQELKRFMIDKAKLGLNHGSMFGIEGALHVRMNVACPQILLEQGLEQLLEAVLMLRNSR